MTARARTARERLAALREHDLADLHRTGTTPDLAQLDGPVDGDILDSPMAQRLRLWRGKVFTPHHDGHLTGLNRVGLAFGLLETHRYRFEARIGTSLFSNRAVLLLDHDLDGNPDWIRRFHDEVVQVAPGLLLATSHHRTRAGDLKHLCLFGLAVSNSATKRHQSGEEA